MIINLLKLKLILIMLSRQFSNLENVEIERYKHLRGHDLGVEAVKFVSE